MNIRFLLCFVLVGFLSACQNTSQIPQNTDTKTGETLSQSNSDASTVDWSQAKFSHEDVDFFLPSDKKIPLPENIDAKTLFLKPSLQGGNVKLERFFLALDGWKYNVSIRTSIYPKLPWFEADFWLGIYSSGNDIFANVYNRLVDDPTSESVDNPEFFTTLKVPNNGGKIQKMWKFTAPKDRVMRTEVEYYNAMNYNNLAGKIVIDVSEIRDALASNDESRTTLDIQFPIFPLIQETWWKKWVLPKEIRAITKTGDVIILERQTDAWAYGNMGNSGIDYMHVCNDAIDDIDGWAKNCFFATFSAKWLQNLATIEVQYDADDIKRIQDGAKLANFALHTPHFEGDENTTHGRKGIFYFPKLPFTLPQKPKDDEALLVFDVKSLNKTLFISSLRWRFDAMQGVGEIGFEMDSKDDDAKVQTDTFFFFPNAQKQFLRASAKSLWHGTIKWKVKYLEELWWRDGVMNPENTYVGYFLIAQEGDFYHIQTEQNAKSWQPYVYDISAENISKVKTFIFDLSRLKDMWQEAELIKKQEAIEFLVETPFRENDPYTPKNAIITFHDGNTREIPFEDNAKQLTAWEKWEFIFTKIHEEYWYKGMNKHYAVRVSPHYAKDVARIEMKFE